MNESKFNQSAEVFKKKWRAECNSKNGHWKGKWQGSYHEAFEEGDRHRYGGNGQNDMHDIVIVMEVRSSAKI